MSNTLIQMIQNLDNIDKNFLSYLNAQDVNLLNIINNKRRKKEELSSQEICDIAIYLDQFLQKLFNIKYEDILINYHTIYKVNKNFVQRFAIQKYNNSFVSNLSHDSIKDIFSSTKSIIFQNTKQDLTDYSFADCVNKLYGKSHFKDLNLLKDNDIDILAKYASILAHKKISNNFRTNYKNSQTGLEKYSSQIKIRDEDLNRTYKINHDDVMYNTNYCIKCHKNNKDSCRNGINENLSGCPLDQHISEMIEMYSKNYIIGSLSVAMIENPLLCLTGDKICNDCSKSCIFQGYEKVDIPKIESYIFSEVIKMKNGVELYKLLLSWNPLITKEKYLTNDNYNGKDIAICGLGPAGIAMSYYSIRDGYFVFAFDGAFIDKKYHNVDGFGGVMRYGITSRWNKENLNIIRQYLLSHDRFVMFGSIKYNKNLMHNLITKFNFDKIIIASGAKHPKKLNQETDSTISGIYNASDFLMHLNLMNLYKISNKRDVSSIKISLPMVIIGSGLTAMDVAQEAAMLYVRQVINFYNSIKKINNLSDIFSKNEDIIQAKIFINDAKKLTKMISKNESIIDYFYKNKLISIVYHKNISLSPSYNQNKTELQDAINHGVNIIENTNILSISHEKNKIINIKTNNGSLFANTVVTAFGTETSSNLYDDKIMYIGDSNPLYHGSVVNAILSAKVGIKNIDISINGNKNYLEKKSKLNDYFNIKYKIRYLKNNLNIIMIKSHYMFDNLDVGGLAKLVIYNKDTKSDTIPVTIAKKYNSRMYIYIKNVGRSTELVLQSGISISIMPSSNMFMETIKTWKMVNIVHDDSRYFIAKCISKSLIKMGFYVNVFNIHDVIDGVDNSIIYSSIESLGCKSSLFKHLQNAYYVIDVRMQCMLGGVCGKCCYRDKDAVQHGCEKYIAKVENIDIDNMKNRSKYLDIL
jgi:NADPH-dependent glutamate synthase beta subunit-like oxidoreductase